MDNKPNFSREVKLQWAGSRERNLASGRGGAFFLTSLFIERFDRWSMSETQQMADANNPNDCEGGNQKCESD